MGRFIRQKYELMKWADKTERPPNLPDDAPWPPQQNVQQENDGEQQVRRRRRKKKVVNQNEMQQQNNDNNIHDFDNSQLQIAMRQHDENQWQREISYVARHEFQEASAKMKDNKKHKKNKPPNDPRNAGYPTLPPSKDSLITNNNDGQNSTGDDEIVYDPFAGKRLDGEDDDQSLGGKIMGFINTGIEMLKKKQKEKKMKKKLKKEQENMGVAHPRMINRENDFMNQANRPRFNSFEDNIQRENRQNHNNYHRNNFEDVMNTETQRPNPKSSQGGDVFSMLGNDDIEDDSVTQTKHVQDNETSRDFAEKQKKWREEAYSIVGNNDHNPFLSNSTNSQNNPFLSQASNKSNENNLLSHNNDASTNQATSSDDILGLDFSTQGNNTETDNNVDILSFSMEPPQNSSKDTNNLLSLSLDNNNPPPPQNGSNNDNDLFSLSVESPSTQKTTNNNDDLFSLSLEPSINNNSSNNNANDLFRLNAPQTSSNPNLDLLSSLNQMPQQTPSQETLQANTFTFTPGPIGMRTMQHSSSGFIPGARAQPQNMQAGSPLSAAYSAFGAQPQPRFPTMSKSDHSLSATKSSFSPQQPVKPKESDPFSAIDPF